MSDFNSLIDRGAFEHPLNAELDHQLTEERIRDLTRKLRMRYGVGDFVQRLLARQRQERAS